MSSTESTVLNRWFSRKPLYFLWFETVTQNSWFLLEKMVGGILHFHEVNKWLKRYAWEKYGINRVTEFLIYLFLAMSWKIELYTEIAKYLTIFSWKLISKEWDFPLKCHIWKLYGFTIQILLLSNKYCC